MKKQNQSPKAYALADVVLRMVVKEDERLMLHPRAAEGFKMAMEAVFSHPALDPKEELEAVVRLGWMFQRDQALELADGIVDLIAQDDRALSLLGISCGRTTRMVKQRFSRLAGTKTKLAAPVFGTAAPIGSRKVSSFLEPGTDMRQKAIARKAVNSR